MKMNQVYDMENAGWVFVIKLLVPRWQITYIYIFNEYLTLLKVGIFWVILLC